MIAQLQARARSAHRNKTYFECVLVNNVMA